jgi:hypothetical protein
MKNYLFIIVFAIISLNGFAQGGGKFKEKKEKIKALKIAYITDELKLTTDEAAKFWPLFNSFDEKQKEFRLQKFKNKLNNESLDGLSEKDATTLLNQIENSEDELYKLRKKFIVDLKSVLPATKILKLKKAEEGFNKKLLQQYRDNKLKD